MDTKALIADAAYRLLTKYPITELTLIEIAHEAGVSKRTVYNHFQDKFEIAQYLCKQIDDEYYLNKNVSLADLCGGTPERHYGYFWKHTDFFRNILCYMGQNNLMDYMSELFLKRILRNIRELQGCDEISEDLLAAAEYYAYAAIPGTYAMLRGVIPQRYLRTDKTCVELYMPAPLLNLFSKSGGAGAPQKNAASAAQKLSGSSTAPES